MARRKKSPLVVQFLVPTYDRRGAPYPRRRLRAIEEELARRFDGWSLVSRDPLPGAWRNPATDEIEHDHSLRYEVGIPLGRLAEFDDYLAALAFELGQKALWRVVYSGGAGKVIIARAPRERGSHG